MNRFTLLLLLLPLLASFANAADPKSPKDDELPACDPVATAKWMTSLFGLSEEKRLIFNPERSKWQGSQVPSSQIPLAQRAKIHFADRGIGIDQEGLLPVFYQRDGGGIVSLKVIAPFIIPSAVLRTEPGFIQYGKDIAMLRKPEMFRTVGEMLHSHFCELAKTKPEHYRTEDVMGYPTDVYIWEVGGSVVFLTAYKRNDNLGVILKICRESYASGRKDESGLKEIERLRARASQGKPSKQKNVFRGWGAPLDHKTD